MLKNSKKDICSIFAGLLFILYAVVCTIKYFYQAVAYYGSISVFLRDVVNGVVFPLSIALFGILLLFKQRKTILLLPFGVTTLISLYWVVDCLRYVIPNLFYEFSMISLRDALLEFTAFLPFATSARRDVRW